MKKIAILAILVVLLAVSVVPAFAANGPQYNRGTGAGICTGDQVHTGGNPQARLGIRNPFALSGTITALDPQTKTVTVAISCGNRLVDSYLGTEVTLQTIESTRFLLRNADGTTSPITYNELVIGESVSSHGSLVDGVFSASRVTMGALLFCIQ